MRPVIWFGLFSHFFFSVKPKATLFVFKNQNVKRLIMDKENKIKTIILFVRKKNLYV